MTAPGGRADALIHRISQEQLNMHFIAGETEHLGLRGRDQQIDDLGLLRACPSWSGIKLVPAESTSMFCSRVFTRDPHWHRHPERAR